MYDIYRSVPTRESVKQIFFGAFKISYAAGNWQVELNLMKMRRDETINIYNSRAEEIFQKICSSIIVGKSEGEAVTIQEAVKERTINNYVNGLRENGRENLVTYALFTHNKYSVEKLVLLLDPVPKLIQSASTRILFTRPSDSSTTKIYCTRLTR